VATTGTPDGHAMSTPVCRYPWPVNGWIVHPNQVVTLPYGPFSGHSVGASSPQSWWVSLTLWISARFLTDFAII